MKQKKYENDRMKCTMLLKKEIYDEMKEREKCSMKINGVQVHGGFKRCYVLCEMVTRHDCMLMEALCFMICMYLNECYE